MRQCPLIIPLLLAALALFGAGAPGGLGGFGGLGVAQAAELSGYLSVQSTLYVSDALYPGQEQHAASIALEPEIYHEWENGSSITFKPFLRLDSADPERTHLDIREMSFLWLNDTWELRAGVSKVFWGVTEFVHLVDIINQTDLVESPDGEDKLGQPMLYLSVPRSWGTLEFFVLPYFRERTYPGVNGRLRSSLPVDTDSAEYESAAQENHVDFALRYSHTLGPMDFGVYHFRGTGREPALIISNNGDDPTLVPYYEQIQQTGLDAQAALGSWLLKFEGINRASSDDNFNALAGGFEYTLNSILGSMMDLGVIGQYAYDERGLDSTTPFQNDAILGLRLALNDLAGTELLTGFVQDLDRTSRMLSVEGSRRLGDNWKASLEARAFLDAEPDDLLYSLRDDDYLKLELKYYY